MSFPQIPVEVLDVSPLDILLDPNSFRLVEDPLWEPIRDDEIADPEVQRRTFDAVLQEAQSSRPSSMKTLRDSIQAQGWMEVDPLLVRRAESGALIVVDGNRRLVAWRMDRQPLPAQRMLFESAGPEQVIRVHQLERPASAEAWRALWIRHQVLRNPWSILGTTIWRERYHAVFGEWPPEAWRRPIPGFRLDSESIALDLARRFRSGTWGSYFEPHHFQMLVEVVGSRKTREWLGIDDVGNVDEVRFDQLISWLVPREEHQPVLGRPRPFGAKGARAPIESWRDIRLLSAVIDDPTAVEQLDAGIPIETRRTRVSPTGHPVELEPDSYLHPLVEGRIGVGMPLEGGKAQKALNLLREAIRRAKEEPVESGTQHPWSLLEPERSVRLRSLTLGRYRGLTGVTLADLQRVNLLVGVNNAGKTTVLEAVYLLSRLSDPRGLLDTLRVRTRHDPERNPSLLSYLIEKLEVDIQAEDSSKRDLSLTLSRLTTAEGTDLSTHIPGIRIDAVVAGARHTTTTELFSQRPRRTVQVEGKSEWLAHAVLHSPYARMDRAAIMQCYEDSVEAKALSVVVDALKQAVDEGIVDIRLVSESGRFVVEHRDRDPMDISSYGEGLQRIFEIGILFAAHRGGFVLIDELETAIHPSAMLRFTKLVQELAVKFNVQVFITTHSKETVDAFLLNGFRTEDIAAYGLYRKQTGLEVVRYAGVDLVDALDAINIDIRRG